MSNPFDYNRLAIIVKRKLGISVVRNYEKRVVREFFRYIDDNMRIDLVVFIKKTDGLFSEKKDAFYKAVKDIEKNVFSK